MITPFYPVVKCILTAGQEDFDFFKTNPTIKAITAGTIK
jgi:hypothetical protein